MEISSYSSIVWILIAISLVRGQEDSLRSALNAVDRRQRYLMDYSNMGYQFENPSDVSFLSGPSSFGGHDFEQEPSEDYIDGSNDIGKQVSTSYRERAEKDNREKQIEELAERILANLDADGGWTDDEYKTRESLDKYRRNPESGNNPKSFAPRTRKRNFYPQLGLDSIGLRKRSRHYQPEYDDSYVSNYVASPDFDETWNEPPSKNYNWNRNPYPQREARFGRFLQSPVGWSTPRHYPVTKRSSDYNGSSKSKKKQHKKEHLVKTDPKVVKDLSSVFGTDSKEKLKVSKTHKDRSSDKSLKKDNKPDKVKDDHKENVGAPIKETVNKSSEKPIQISKKSIDWSDYFGLDRRKKSEDLDKEWLMERYHKAISVTTKRNAEYPLQSFHKHDDNEIPETEKKSDKSHPDEFKIEQMDAKLKGMEDKLVDDALKYTGAHEGITDSKEIQEVKDRIISQLAAAYSLEKMRRALGEYKMNIDKEKERLKDQEGNNDDFTFSEEKRVSVPRKEAVDPDKEKTAVEDNHIKCSHGDPDCEAPNYRTSMDVIEQSHFNTEGCPKIQRACNEVSTILGQYAKMFEAACNTHQMCLLCGNNSWFAPTRQCNMLFLTRAADLCEGQPECRKEAQNSVRYLLDVNRSLRTEPLEDCDLSCPEGTDGR